MNVFDREFALAQIEAFEADKSKAQRITLQMWEQRPWTERLEERAAALFRSQL